MCQRRCFAGGILRTEEERRAWGRWADVDTIRGGLGGKPPKPHARVHGGGYRALASRRRYIPKADGRRPPLGIAALEGKIVQAAVAAILTPIYETEFLGFSYGFRPERGQHDALDALAYGLGKRRINWVLDADIRSFFDTISHAWLIRFIEHRIGDRRIVRLIRKWLAAGVLEEGRKIETVEGTPQGAVISPLLANVYLHYVYDLWVRQWRQRQSTGDMIVGHYAATRLAASSAKTTRKVFSKTSQRAWPISDLVSTPKRRGSSSSAGRQLRPAALEVSASRRRSTSLGSRTIARPDEAAAASCWEGRQLA